MHFNSVRIITADIKKSVAFYENITASPAKWLTEDFAELFSNAFTLAIGSTRTLKFFGEGIAEAASNKSIILEFRVDDVDREFERVKGFTDAIVQLPTTMPWGNRSLLFRDPDNNLVNFFTPMTQDAKNRVGLKG